MSIATTLGPTGVENKMDSKIPKVAHTTDSTAEQIVTDKKFLNIRMADRAGKMIRAEMSREPTKFIANTMTTAMMTSIGPNSTNGWSR